MEPIKVLHFYRYTFEREILKPMSVVSVDHSVIRPIGISGTGKYAPRKRRKKVGRGWDRPACILSVGVQQITHAFHHFDVHNHLSPLGIPLRVSEMQNFSFKISCNY